MEKVWLKNYQPGVPSTINPDQYPSINEIVEEVCLQFSDKPAFENMGKILTYQMLEEQSRAFAAYCLEELKLKRGDRVALMMPNILQYAIALFGTLRAGLTVVNFNPLYTPRELQHQLQDSGCVAIVVLSNFASTLAQVLDQVSLKHVVVTEIGDLLSFPKSILVNFVVKHIKKMIPSWSIKNHIAFIDVLDQGKNLAFHKPSVTGNDIAFLQYTGGTTGVAKAAMLTHRNMVANIEQDFAWIKPAIKIGEEIIITALPLYHIFSLTANCLTFMKAGALNVLVTNPRDMKSFLKILARFSFTAITGVNTLFNALLNQPAFAKLDFSQLRIALGGGMAVQHAVAERWKAVTGVTLIEAYGLTETAPGVCINPLNLKEFNGSIGLPISSTDVSIRDDAGQEVGLNALGELWVRGPQVMQGYWQNPTETAVALQDGWVRTGDIASINADGFVRIVDRKKDLIIVSGFNVYPNEVEDVIAEMEEVKEVAVVGIPIASGEKVKAFIVKKDPNLTVEAILKFCATELTAYKVPKEIEFRTELPKTNVGKILRRALREESTNENHKNSN